MLEEELDMETLYDDELGTEEASEATTSDESPQSSGIVKKESSNNTSLESNYSTYVDLIDLTHDFADVESSDNESLPEVSFFKPTRTEIMTTKDDVIRAKEILIQHQQKVIIEEDFQRVHIRRKTLYSDALRAFSRLTFNPSKMLRVTFIGEPAIDDGGPRREFFGFLMKDIFSISGLFTGWPSNVVPIHSIEGVLTNKFFVVGLMMATCLIQGGEAPLCFARAVADYLVFDAINSAACIDDISDYDIQMKLKQVQQADSDEKLSRVLDSNEYDFRFLCGYSKPLSSINLSNRNEFITSIWLHHVYFSVHAELQQFKDGFKSTLKVEDLIRNYPDEMYVLLTPSKSFKVTAAFFLDEAMIMYSDEGSNKRVEEEAVILHWSDYIVDCSGPGKVSFSDLLQFITCSRRVPAVGFDNLLSILFTDTDRLPAVSSCVLSITFSRSFHKMNYDEFKEMMDASVLDSCGFGQP